MAFVVVSVIQKQLACILGRQQVFFELDDDYSELMDLMRNSSLNTHFINLAREVCHSLHLLLFVFHRLHSLCCCQLASSRQPHRYNYPAVSSCIVSAELHLLIFQRCASDNICYWINNETILWCQILLQIFDLKLIENINWSELINGRRQKWVIFFVETLY